jgi:molybdopterin converting factor small subunit
VKAAPVQPITVHVEVLSWVNRFVGGPGTGEVRLDEAVPRGGSVRAVLRALSDRFPELGRALWDPTRPRELGDNIEVLVNNAVLGVSHDLDSEVLDGDRITLLGQYMGGSTETRRRPGPPG